MSIKRPPLNNSGLNDVDHQKLVSELTKYADEGASDDDLIEFRNTFISQKKKSTSKSNSPTRNQNSESEMPTGSSATKDSDFGPGFKDGLPQLSREDQLRSELANVKVTAENQDEVSRKTDELSALVKTKNRDTYFKSEVELQPLHERINAIDNDAVNQGLIDEENDQQVTDYLREGAKNIGNMAIGLINTVPKTINALSGNAFNIPTVDPYTKKVPFQKEKQELDENIKEIKAKNPEYSMSPEDYNAEVKRLKTKNLIEEQKSKNMAKVIGEIQTNPIGWLENTTDAISLISPNLSVGASSLNKIVQNSGFLNSKEAELISRLKIPEILKLNEVSEISKGISGRIQLLDQQAQPLKKIVEHDRNYILNSGRATQEEIDDWNEKSKTLNSYYLEYTSLLKQQQEADNTKMSAEDHVKQFALDYAPMSKLADDVLGPIGGLFGGMAFLAGKGTEKVSEALNIPVTPGSLPSSLLDAGQTLLEDSNLRASSHPSYSVDNITEHPIGWLGQTMGVLLPYMLTEGGGGIISNIAKGQAVRNAGFISSSMGKKAFEMDEEMKANPFTDYSNWQYSGALLGSAASEAFMLKAYGKILKGSKPSIEAIAKNPESKKIFEDGIRSLIQKTIPAGKEAFYAANRTAMDGAGIAAINTLTDNLILGKKTDFKDTAWHSMKEFAALGFGGHIVPAMVKQISELKVNKAIKKNYSKIEDLTSELTIPNLTPEDRISIQGKINEVVKSNADILLKSREAVSNMTTPQFKRLMEIGQEQFEIKKEAKRLKNNSNLSEELKNELIADQVQKFNKTEDERTAIFNDKNNALTVLPSKEQIRLKNIASKELMKEQNPDGTKNVTIEDNEITQRAIEIHKNELKEAETKMAEMPSEKAIEQPTDVEVAPSVSEKEVIKPTEDVSLTNEVNIQGPIENKGTGATEKNNFNKKSIEDLEKRQFEIEGDKNYSNEFNQIDKELEKREWQSVLNESIDNIPNIIDGLIKKEKEKPNGFGSYIDKRDARETKEVAEKYSKEVSKLDAKKDFKDSFFGNPDNWYADALKLRESVRVFTEKGGGFKELLEGVQKEFEQDGFSEQDAAGVIKNKLDKISKVNEAAPTADITIDGDVRPNANIVEQNRVPEQEVNQPEVISESVDSKPSESDAPSKIKHGSFEYEYKGGEWIATDKNGNAKAVTQSVRKIISGGKVKEKLVNNNLVPAKVYEKHAENFDFTSGKTAIEQDKINSVNSWEKDVAEHSENPAEIAETLLFSHTQDFLDGVDYRTKVIAEGIGKINQKSFVNISDKSNITMTLAKAYLNKKGADLDTLAQELSEKGVEITEQDIVDFMLDNPNGPAELVRRLRKDKIDPLKLAFTDLTGLPPKMEYLEKAVEQQREKINKYENSGSLDNMTDAELLSLDIENKQFNLQDNGERNKTDGGTARRSETSDNTKREQEPGILRPRSNEIESESAENSREQGGNEGELATEHNRSKDLVSERIPYEKIAPKNPPKKLNKIINQVANDLKSTLIYGKSKRGGAGSYNPTNSLVRIKNAGDIDVVAHELGHLLDDRHNILGTIPAADKVEIDKQLKWYSERGGSNPPLKSTPAEKAEYLQREGLAEFIRSLIANPSQTKVIAPELLNHFESNVDSKTKEILSNFSDNFLDFANATAIEKTLSNVEEIDLPNKNKFIEWVKGFRSETSEFSFTNMDKFYSEMANSNHFGIKSFKYLLGMNEKTDIKSHENFEIMSRVFLGINGKLENVFSSGMINGKNEKLKAEGGTFKKDVDGRTVYEDGTAMNVKWLIDGLDTTSEVSLKNEQKMVVAMLVAERGVEYAKKFGRNDNLTGVGGGIDTDLSVSVNALNEFKELEKTNPEQYNRIKEGAKRYRQMADATLKYAVEKGRISEEQYDEIKAKNEYYVALNRNIELMPGEDLFTSFKEPSSSIGTSRDITKKAKGGTASIENPYLSLLKNINNIIKESDRNEVMNSFVEPLTSSRKMGDGEPNDFSKIGRIANDGDKNLISVYRKGKLEKWQFEENIYNSLKELESISSDPILSTLAKPSQLIRWTVTHNPIFYARNIVKDTQARMIISNDHSKLKDMLHNSSDKELFELYGGSQSGHLLTDKESYSGAMSKVSKEIVNKGGIIINPKDFWNKYTKFLQTGENLNRIAEFNNSYRKGKKQGMSDYDAGLYAAFQARDLMDFAVAGHTMRKINQIVVFSNAGVQSLRKASKSLQSNPFDFAYRTTLYSVLPSLAFMGLRSSMGNDDEYEELPDNQRDMFFNFKTPFTGDAWISIPKPYELGLYSAFVDRGVSKIKGYDSAFNGYTGTVMKTLMPFDESSFLGGLKPIVEVGMNRNTFTDAPIIPEHESGKLLELRKNKSKASLISQDVSKLFKEANISVDPRNIDHILKGYGTYFANQGMAISDLAKKEETPVNFWAKQTGFSKDVPSYNAKSVKKATDLAIEIGKIGSKEMKQLRSKIEDFATEQDINKRKEITKSIFVDAKKIVEKYSMEKEFFVKFKEKENELKLLIDKIIKETPVKKLGKSRKYIKAIEDLKAHKKSEQDARKQKETRN